LKDEELQAAEPLLQKQNDQSDKEMELFEPSHNEDTLSEQYIHLKRIIPTFLNTQIKDIIKT
jgi:hypothetical protein